MDNIEQTESGIKRAREDEEESNQHISKKSRQLDSISHRTNATSEIATTQKNSMF